MSDVIEEPYNKGLYSIEAPGILRSNANYKVAITLFEALESSDVQITISGGSFKFDKVVTIQPLSTEVVCFEIPELDPDEIYFLDVESLTGIEFNDSIELIFERGQTLTYIQFDKQAYKRGDKVDFRILLLERELLKPAHIEKPISICLKFAEKLIFDKVIQPEIGLCTDQWIIPDDASHGTYTMKVFIDEILLASKNFEIIDFVPPKFKINVRLPKEIIYAQRQFYIEVEANHFDGTPVNGICKLEIESVSGFFSGIYIEKFIPISGKIERTIIDVVDDLEIDSTFIDSEWFTTASIMIRTIVIEHNTEDQVTLSKLLTLKRDEFIREDINNNECSNCMPCRDCSNCCEMENDNYFYEEEEDNNNPIKIITESKKDDLKIGDNFNFSIKIQKPAKYCIYFVIARGNIIKNELIRLENHNIPIKRNLGITFIYSPRAFVLAYFIYEGILYFDEIGFNISKSFENKLTISVPSKANPNVLIPIEIESSANSIIGIMGIDLDSIVINSRNDLSFEKIFKDLYHVRSQVPELKATGRYPGLMSGMIIFTNAQIDGFELDESADGRYSYFPDREHFENDDWMPRIDIDRKKKKVIREMQERNQVFGNWLFVNKQSNDNGELKFEAILPEKPSTWLISAFALNDENGFVMTEKPVQICTKGTDVIDGFTHLVPIRPVKSKIVKFVFDHYDARILRKTIVLAPPPNVSPVEVTLSINETLFAPIIEHLRDLAGKMYCTGYLHMTTVTPNVAVLEYLDHMKQLDTELAVSIKKRFPEAIKRDLDIRREDKSFGWFCNDTDGSPHVTSLVMQTFQRLAKYVDIDQSIIDEGLAYLASLQEENGEIQKEKQPYKHLFEKGSCVGLTSFVLLSFLKCDSIQKRYKDVLHKGFGYIIANIESIKCIYDLGISFYAMQLYRHPYASTLKDRLLKIALKDNETNQMWWSYFIEPSQDPNFYAVVSEREVTSYIALGLLETEPIETILPIIKWMLPLKDLRSESMDCGLALEVILKTAIKANASSGIINILYTAFNNDDGYNGKLILTPQNSGRIQTHVLPVVTNKIEISTKDNGSFYGNVSYRYREN